MLNTETPELNHKSPIVMVGRGDDREGILYMQSQLCAMPPSPEELATSDKLRNLMDQLGDKALGLAAPQIGIPRSIFVMRRKDGALCSFFNPVVISANLIKSCKPEGCLSIPYDGATNIPRPTQITIGYFTEAGEYKEETFENLEARCVSHEIEHLNGRLITRYIVQEEMRKQKHEHRLLIKKNSDINRRRSKSKLARKARKRNRV